MANMAAGMTIYSWFWGIQQAFLVLILFAAILCHRAGRSRDVRSGRPTGVPRLRFEVRYALALGACGLIGYSSANLLSSPLTERSPVIVWFLFVFLLLNLFSLFKLASFGRERE